MDRSIPPTIAYCDPPIIGVGSGSVLDSACRIGRNRRVRETKIHRSITCSPHQRHTAHLLKPASGRIKPCWCSNHARRSAEDPSIAAAIFRDELMGMEVHVKDESRFPGKWAFFAFDDSGGARETHSLFRRLLFLPRAQRRSGHHVRAVLPDSVRNSEAKRNAEAWLRRITVASRPMHFA